MSNTLDILHPVKTVKIAGETVEVHELPWPEAVAFLQELSAHLGRMLTSEGRLSLSPEKLPELVQASAGLLERLVCKATGKDASWLKTLNPAQVLEILDAAVELNLSPQLLHRGKAVAGRLQAAFGFGPTGDASTKSSPNAAIS